MNFINYSRLDRRCPTKKGTFIVLMEMRDGGQIPQIRFFDPDAELDKQWIIPKVSTYGYSDFIRTGDYGIVAFAELEGMELNIVPEQMSINIPGYFKEDDE